MRLTLCASLILFLWPVSAGPGRGAGDETGSPSPDLRRRLTSPYLRERERALASLVRQGKDAIPRLEKLLGDPDHRVRALAARGLGQVRDPEGLHALLRRLRTEGDPRLVDAIAVAMVPYGRIAWTAIREQGREKDAPPGLRRAHHRFLWEYIVSMIHRILSENTDAGGEFKGFYDGQFAEVGSIGPEAADILLRMILDRDRFPISVRQFAIRAMAEVGNESHIPVLRKFFDSLSHLNDDPFFFAPDPEVVLLIYTRRVLARLGDIEPCMRKVSELKMKIIQNRDLKDRAGTYQYNLAYEWHQIRNYDRAIQEYQRYLHDYPREVLDYYNSRHYAWYNLCCVASKLGDTKRALYYLQKAFDENYTDFAWLELDRDLDNIRHLVAYQKMVAKQKAKFLPPEPPKEKAEKKGKKNGSGK